MTPQMLPATRPGISLPAAITLAGEFYDPTMKVWLLGRRGYYADSMGEKGQNDRGIYDDAIALITPYRALTFNANTDPQGQGGTLAVLQPGRWEFKWGTHHPGTPNAYPCLVQAAPVAVHRDNGVTETGEFYIHIHHGFNTETGSAGCQTVALPQWDEFEDAVRGAMHTAGMKTIPYILTARANAGA